jgi:hypothetical protein
LIILAGVAVVQVTQSISAKAIKPVALTQPAVPPQPDASPSARPVQVASEPISAPAGLSPVEAAEKRLGEEDHASNASPSEQQAGSGAEAVFYPPEPAGAAIAETASVAGPKLAEDAVRSKPGGPVDPRAKATAGENSAHPVPHTISGAEPAAPTASGRMGEAGLLSMARPDTKLDIGKPAISEASEKPVSPAEESRIALQVAHQRQAAQAALHQDVAQLVQQIGSAMQFDDLARVEALMNQLEKAQSPNSLFVIRLKAYWRIRQNRLAQARTLLEQVLSRMPGDRESGLNLAVVDMRLGHAEAARQRLKQLQDLYPEDRRITDALEKLDSQTR